MKMHLLRWLPVDFPFSARDARKNGNSLFLHPGGERTVLNQIPNLPKGAPMRMVVLMCVTVFMIVFFLLFFLFRMSMRVGRGRGVRMPMVSMFMRVPGILVRMPSVRVVLVPVFMCFMV